MDVTELVHAFTVDPAAIHQPGYGAPVVDDGAWAAGSTYTTSTDCYEAIAAQAPPGSVTIETGCGLSTLVFALCGCDHTAFFLDPDEEHAVRAVWAATHDVDVSAVHFVVGPSDAGLRAWHRPVDVFLIDGGHGYPIPQVDWFYGASWVRRGGVVVIDDRQLWGPRQLDAFVRRDPRWTKIERTRKWSAYRRLGDGSVVEDYDAQPFLPERELPRPPRPDLNWRGRAVDKMPKAVREPLKRLLS